MGSSFSAELLELIDNRLEYQVMTDSEREGKLLLVVIAAGLVVMMTTFPSCVVTPRVLF